MPVKLQQLVDVRSPIPESRSSRILVSPAQALMDMQLHIVLLEDDPCNDDITAWLQAAVAEQTINANQAWMLALPRSRSPDVLRHVRSHRLLENAQDIVNFNVEFGGGVGGRATS